VRPPTSRCATSYPDAPAQLPLDEVLARLKPWLEDATPPSSARTSSTTRHVLANAGITVRGYQHDTLLQSYVLEAHKPHSLEAWPSATSAARA
jgi:DNA polymerase-1